MSSSPGGSDGSVTPSRSWRSNGSNPASDVSGPLPPDSQSPGEESDGRPWPTPEERIRGLLDQHHEKMFTPVSEEHGRKLREEALADPEVEMREVAVGEGETVTFSETVERAALPLVAVMEEFLDWYEGYRNKYLRLVRGNGYTEGKEEYLVDLDNSFQPGYQKATYAKLKALKRQAIGGRYPDGSECEGALADPVTVLFSLSSSGVRSDGTPRPIVDHAREGRDAWVGSSSSVKRTLRYVLEDKLGLESSEYVWWYQSEPHPGDGQNAGYAHAHPVVVLDAAAVRTDADPADPETYRAVVAKHVAECEGAEWSAHRIRREGKSAVKVKKADEIQDFASYVSEYLAVAPDQDLLERSDEYLMYAAANWASTSQKYSKSGTATAAIEADKCHQRYADPEARQDHDHGEEVTRRDGELVCFGCGESFGVEQGDGTLTERRLAADGGADVVTGGAPLRAWNEEEGRFETDDVEARWPSARHAGAVGSETVERECDHGDGANECPLCAESVGAVDPDVPIPESASAPDAPECRVDQSRRREPRWRPEAIVNTETEEETLIGAPGGSVFGEVVVEGAGSVGVKLDGRTLLPEWLEGPRPWESAPVSEAEVRNGEVPPPELVAREYAESLQPGRRVTAKEWPEDWYARRYERDGDGDEQGTDVDRERVEEFVRTHPGASVVAVMGALGLSPDARSLVASVVEDVE